MNEMVGGGSDDESEDHIVSQGKEHSNPRGLIWSSSYPQVVTFSEVYCLKVDVTIDDAHSLDFLPPVEQLTVMICQLEKLKKDNGHEYGVTLNNKYVDVGKRRKVVVLHDVKVIKYQVEQENEWFCKLSDTIHQPKGTPGLDSRIPSTCNSMLHETSEGHYWSALQLKTCEIQRLAVNRWLSDLIVYCIAELLNESNPDIYVFYYTFNSDIKDVIREFKHPQR